MIKWAQALKQETKKNGKGLGTCSTIFMKTTIMHVCATRVLFNLVINDEIKKTYRFLHAIPPFIDLLKFKPLEAQHDVAMAFYHLSSL
jgi:hypothetical protein